MANPLKQELIPHDHHDNDVLDLEDLLCFDKKDGSVSMSKPEPQQDEVQFEEDDEDEDDMLVVKPYGLLNEIMSTPPFLSKTYEIVENIETNEIISWGENGVSFVVWDEYKFTTHLLPKFFKHSNFSSFVRQLNTYGFRKVNFDRWEFANAAFQRGKKHLLKSIKRNYHGGNKNNNSRLNFQREIEIEELKLEQETLKSEIHDLKQQQLKSNQSLASMEERAKSVEWKQKEMLLFVAKAMKRTRLFQQLLLQYRQKKTLEYAQVFKRRKLASSESFNVSPRRSLEEQSSSLTSSETDSSDLSSGNYIMWEKLMEDDVICEDDDDEEAFDVDQTNFVHELEDLIARSPLRGSLANVGDEVSRLGGE